MTGRLLSLDVAVLAVYLAGIVAVGLWFGRKGRTAEEFTAAGGAVPGWAVGLSIFGTYVSSISFLALPGKAFGGDWNPFVFSLSIPLTAWLAVRFFVPFYRRGETVSAYEHLERRFGPWARTYAVVCYLLTQLARTATILYLLALTLAPLTGWSVTAIILVAGVLVVVYTLFGGMEAVIWTDVVQSVVLIGGAATCLALLLTGLPDGPGQLVRIASEHHKFSLGSFGPSLGESTFWVVLIYGLCINLQNFGIDQSYVQRYFTARTDREAARSVWLGALLYVPISAVFLLIGTGLFAFYTVRPDRLPAGIDPQRQPDAVFPHFIVAELPAGVTGLVLAAIFAAAQSTVSSSINSSATLILCDLYKRYWRPDAGEAESMRVLRTATLLVGCAGTAAALAMMQARNVLDIWWQMAGLFSGGMLGLFLLGMLSRRAGSGAALTGVAAGLLAIVWMTLSPRWPGLLEGLRSPLHNLLTVAVGTLVLLTTGLLVAHRRPVPPAPDQLA